MRNHLYAALHQTIAAWEWLLGSIAGLNCPTSDRCAYWNLISCGSCRVVLNDQFCVTFVELRLMITGGALAYCTAPTRLHRCRVVLFCALICDSFGVCGVWAYMVCPVSAPLLWGAVPLETIINIRPACGASSLRWWCLIDV